MVNFQGWAFVYRKAVIISALRSHRTMSFARSLLAVVLCYALALPGFAQTHSITGDRPHGLIPWFSNNYTPHAVPGISFADSPRLEKLLRAGIIYLSLRDAIALALEN